MKNEAYDFDRYGIISGKNLLSELEDKIGLSTEIINDVEDMNNKVITYPMLFDILDYYFFDIVKLNLLEAESGVLSRNGGKWFITYGTGKVFESDNPPTFEVRGESCEVNVILSNGEIIEIIPSYIPVGIREIYNKAEISGKLFVEYDNVIIINSDGMLKKFITTDKFEILRRTNRDATEIEIVIIKGTYKKYMNVTAVAVERIL